jgi:AcrR family transcriptional regulator
MGDIAKAADMSRPALYLLFSDKEAAFEAAVDHLNVIRLDEIRAALECAEGLSARLFVICNLWLINVYELTLHTPDAADMDDLNFGVTRRVYGELQALIVENLRATCLAPADAKLVNGLARNLVYSVRGLARAAQDVEDMRRMTALQIDILCRALGQN